MPTANAKTVWIRITVQMEVVRQRSAPKVKPPQRVSAVRRTASGQGPSVAVLPRTSRPESKEVRITARPGPAGTSARHKRPRKTSSSPKAATSAVRNAAASDAGPDPKTPPERVSAQTSSGKRSRRRFLHWEDRLKPASGHQPVHISKPRASTVASAQNMVSGLFRSERIRPRPTGGSKAFCGSFATLPTGVLGIVALLARSSPNTASVTSTEKAKGRRPAKRLTCALLYAVSRSELLLEAGEDEVEPELELRVVIHMAQRSAELVDVGEVFRRERGGADTGAGRLHRKTADLGHGVAGSVARKRAEGVQRRLGGESSPPQRLEKLFDQPDPIHRVRRTNNEQWKHVRVLVRQPPESPVSFPDPSLPALFLRRYLQLTEQDLDHPIQQSTLVRDVVVERHRLDPQLTPELAHAES